MKTALYIVIILALLTGGFFVLNHYIYSEKQGDGVPMNHKNATYVIEGQEVTLVNGESEVAAAPGSASKIVTKYFGNEVTKDLNSDGREDVIFLITQNQGGSGTFYYAVAALNTENGFVGSHALLLGDRIAPQTTESREGNKVVINYADRNPGEPMSTKPSVGKSIQLLFNAETMQFGEVVVNFEGEADPSKMTLDMKKWEWVNALYNDERVITPKIPGQFSVVFGKDGRFTTTTDCNSVAGSYVADTKNGTIAFSNIISTKKFCEGSQETEFIQMLSNSTSYHFTGKGELILDLKFDSGSVVFR